MKHLKYLHQIFNKFNKLNVILKTLKLFLEFFLAILLKQHVNILNITIISEKIKTISSLNFLIILKVLEIYLELIK